MLMEDEDRLLRRPEVETMTGLSCSAIYRLMDEGKFPRPKKIGPHAVRWPLFDIRHWITGVPRA